MKLYTEFSLEGFDAWSGAIDTKNRILDEGKGEEFEVLMDELYPDGISETELNDILWFEDDWIFEELGIKDEDEEEESEEEEDDEDIFNEFCNQYGIHDCGDCPLKEIEDCEEFVNSIYHEDYNVSLESLTKKVVERINK